MFRSAAGIHVQMQKCTSEATPSAVTARSEPLRSSVVSSTSPASESEPLAGPAAMAVLRHY